MSKEHHFIAISDMNDHDTHKLIREKYDLILNKEIYDDNSIIPKVYQELKNYIDKLDITKKIPVTISSDRVISTATIAGINEKFIIQLDDNKFTSNLKIIYFTDKPSLITNEESSLNNFILSSLFNLVDDSIIKTNTMQELKHE